MPLGSGGRRKGGKVRLWKESKERLKEGRTEGRKEGVKEGRRKGWKEGKEGLREGVKEIQVCGFSLYIRC